MKPIKVTVIGSGTWGTALAILLAENCTEVILKTRDQEAADTINREHRNPKYLSEISLPKNLIAVSDYSTVNTSQVVVLATPTSAAREVSEEILKVGFAPDTQFVSVSKGIERGTGKRMTEVIAEVLNHHKIAALSGPNHAEEVSQKLPTCAVIGASSQEDAEQLQELFSSHYFRTYTSNDLIGIELGGAIKNVYAIAAGIAKGLGLGDNAIAALVTRGLAEMTRFGALKGGNVETFSGLSGVGDLMTTCYSAHSRNHQVGLSLAKGLTRQEASDKLGMVAEGIPNTRSIFEEAERSRVETPLINAVYSILYDGKSAQKALQELLTRELKAE